MGEAGAEHQAADAFGREPPSLWRRWFRGGESAAPKWAAKAVGATTAGLLLIASGALHDRAAKLAAFVVLAVPGVALERFFKARRRRERERLLPPAGGP